MRLSEAVERLETVVTTTGSPDADTTAIGHALAASSALKSFLAAQDAELARMLAAQPGSFPEATIADSTRCSLGDAGRTTERATTLDAADAMADALADGEISTDHVDALTRAGRQLDDHQRTELFDQHNQLAQAAASQTAGEFAKHLKNKINDLQRESGDDRLRRQRRARRVRTWTDGDDMFHLSGVFDPATGAAIAQQLRHTTATITAAGVPDDAPSDPVERQRFIDALATEHLLLRPTSNAGTAPTATPIRSSVDAVVVVDATQATVDGSPTIDAGLPVELPIAVLEDLFHVRRTDVVVVANGIILHAPGNLNLGRTTRIANRDQRRALRGLYSTCAVPGCTVHYDRCKLHHVTWWRHGGRTDLDNLLPVCQHHHTRLHDDHWHVTLGPNRELTIRTPNGQTIRAGPPKRSAA